MKGLKIFSLARGRQRPGPRVGTLNPPVRSIAGIRSLHPTWSQLGFGVSEPRPEGVARRCLTDYVGTQERPGGAPLVWDLLQETAVPETGDLVRGNPVAS